MVKSDILIIGGGLTGLTLHYLLNQNQYNAVTIEARDRLGGRIFTSKKPGMPPIEMGATWFGYKHRNLVSLLKQLDLEWHPQKMDGKAIYEPLSNAPFQIVKLPENEEPSFRIKGGSFKLIEKLNQNIEPHQIHLEEIVESIQVKENNVITKTQKTTFQSKIVISTLPPNLLIHSIKMEPQLPEELTSLMVETHTWMGDSIKIGLVYKAPFWRDKKTSSTIFSNAGPITELYDHSNFNDTLYALKGFIKPEEALLSKDKRLERILNQLETYYGKVARDFEDYQELVWKEETFTYAPYKKYIFPHQNNGNPLYQNLIDSSRLIIAGSETAGEFPGYMEGAINSAVWVYNTLQKMRALSKTKNNRYE